MSFTAKIFATAFLAVACGFRVSHRKRQNATGQPGQVDEIFNIGGPAVFTSPIENPRGGGCFPGIRQWTMRNNWWGTEADFAPFLTIPFGFHHALQEGMEINRGDQTTVTRKPCSHDQTTDPVGVPVDIHSVGADYIDPTQNEGDDHWYQVLNVGVRNHHNHNIQSVKDSAARHGWDHVHSSFDEGGDVIIGRQVSHLFKHPETRECIVTFQGAGGWRDGMGHPLIIPVSFCGLPTKVHMGFRDGLRHVLNNTDWQANIRSQFPTCSKVIAAGHSLGGMKATLFAYCANQILQPGDDGYDSDYRLVTWTPEQSATAMTRQSPIKPAAALAPRVFSVSKMQPVSSGQPGQVDEVFNIGGPAVFTTPIENPRGGGCFPGIRQWTMRDNWWGTEADYAPFLTLPFGFHHAFQEGMEINRGDQTVTTLKPCSDSTSDMPWGFPADIHSAGSDYIDPTQGHSDHWFQVLNVGVRNHHNHNIQSVKDSAARHGWDHVHSIFDEGGDVVIGRQVSHLFKHPETRECIVTFQGAGGLKDGLGHPLIIPVSFCGLPTYVHMGFRDGLRHVLNNTDWQANIRSQFPTCSKVIAAGHSLGGMKATLFAACANQLLQPGDDGYDSDYSYITWTAQ